MNDNLEIIDKKNIVALIKELQYLNDDVLSKFNGESDKEGNLLEKLTYFNNNLIFFLNENKQLIKEANVAKQELSILFQKLQDSKNLKLEIQSLKLDFVGKKEFDEFLDQYIKKFPIITNKEIFLSELERTSLIKFDDYKVEFLHKSFLDYFIASYFNNRHTELYDNGTFNDIYKLYHSSLWEDVTYFYFGQKSRINKKEIEEFVNKKLNL